MITRQTLKHLGIRFAFPLALLLSGQPNSLLAQDAPMPTIHAVVQDSTGRPSNPQIDEGITRGGSRLPLEIDTYIPMPLPRPKSPKALSLSTLNKHDAATYDLRTGRQVIRFGASRGMTSIASRTTGRTGLRTAFQHQPEKHHALTRNFGELLIVSNPGVYPWSVNVELFQTYMDTAGRERRFVCSGTMIDARVVLTAGHCIYSHSLEDANGVPFTINDWATSVTVVPGYSNGSGPFGTASAVLLTSLAGWTDSEDFNFDIGIITLDRDMGSLTGWQGVAYQPSCNFFTQNFFNNAGYPADTPFSGEFLYRWFGSFDSCDMHQVLFNKLSYGGQSGSQFYFLNQDQRHVHAVLSNGTDFDTGCVRISSAIFDLITELVSRMFL